MPYVVVFSSLRKFPFTIFFQGEELTSIKIQMNVINGKGNKKLQFTFPTPLLHSTGEFHWVSVFLCTARQVYMLLIIRKVNNCSHYSPQTQHALSLVSAQSVEWLWYQLTVNVSYALSSNQSHSFQHVQSTVYIPIFRFIETIIINKWTNFEQFRRILHT